METSCAKAVKHMQAYDPYFDFNDLEVEAKDIFQEFTMVSKLQFVGKIIT